MKLARVIGSAWSVAAVLSVGLALGGACGGGNDGGAGGESGSGGNAGSGGNKAGSGGSGGSKTGGAGGSSNTAGSGGSSTAGSGGGSGGSSTAGTSGGSGAGAGGSSVGGSAGMNPGGMGGGTGGSTGSGGMIGSLTCSMIPPEGTPDEQIPRELIMCGPYCIYRPNWPDHHACGPAGSDLKAAPALKNTGFCGEKYNQDGVHAIEQVKIDAAAFDEPASGMTVQNPVANVKRVYLPGGMAKYNAAPDGKVALTLWTSLFADVQDRFHFENVHEHLVKRNEIPYTIAAFVNGEIAGNDRTKLKGIIDGLRAKYPKISTDPNYIVITGQSTAGGNAFDVAWLNTDLVAKAIGGSASVVCFTCFGGQSTDEFPYEKEVMFCPARPIRWSATVGTCDIYGTITARMDAGCGSGTGAEAVDSSQCGADWLASNRKLQAALKAKGTPAQLFEINRGGHVHEVWGVFAMPWQLRWIFKDITCAQ